MVRNCESSGVKEKTQQTGCLLGRGLVQELPQSQLLSASAIINPFDQFIMCGEGTVSRFWVVMQYCHHVGFAI